MILLFIMGNIQVSTSQWMHAKRYSVLSMLHVTYFVQKTLRNITISKAVLQHRFMFFYPYGFDNSRLKMLHTLYFVLYNFLDASILHMT